MAEFQFDLEDVIVVSDKVQVDWLAQHAGPDLQNAQLYPISLQAYSAALKLGRGRTRPTFSDSDFRVCNQSARAEIFRLSQCWLQELGLSFEVAGLDVPKLDASCQFLLFIYCVYVQGAALNLLRTIPAASRVNIISAAHPLPLEFYFDSDVASAVLRYVLETHGREPRLLMMDRRDEYLFHRDRPMLLEASSAPGDEELRVSKPSSRARSGRYRVGVVAATITNADRYFEALRQLDCETHSFSSAWSPHSEGLGEEAFHCISAANGPWSESLAADLRVLREQFSSRTERSSLPACTVANPHLDFQWSYIFNNRWLGYGNAIMRTQRFANSQPLDLLIHSDHFTAEGAILSHFYRRKRTRVLVAPHSGWPVDPDWALNHRSDLAVVASRTAAERLKAISGVSKVLVAGGELIRPCESLRRASEFAIVANRLRDSIGARKIVLLVTSALELNAVPFTALESHFRALSKLASPPDALRQRVFVAVRRKPGILRDSAELLQELCGFSSEAFSLIDGLTFAECVRLADCVVGVNVATSGYFGVLEEGRPLLHVQMADVAVLHPDLPGTVLPRVAREEELWPTIESLLFDSAQRDEVKRRQQAFTSQDRSSQFHGDSIAGVIRYVQHSDILWRFRSFLAKARPGASGTASPFDLRLPAGLSPAPEQEQPHAGYLDDVLSASNTNYVLLGWAADLQTGEPAKRVHAFLHETLLASCCPSVPRPDVAAAYGNKNLTCTGFRLPLRISHPKELRSVSAYAELRDKQLVRLRDAALITESPGPEG